MDDDAEAPAEAGSTLGWAVLYLVDGCAHVVPVADLVQHEPEWCVCGPNIENVAPDGTHLVLHHALDGRK